MDKKLALHIAPITADELHIDDHVVASLSNATKQIITHGAYINADGEDVYIEDTQELARANTIIYTPHQVIPTARAKYPELYGFVHNQTTLTVAHERYKLGYRVALINCSTFIDSLTTSPLLYRESILRSSSLLYCFDGAPFAIDARDEFRDDTIVVTPQVPIFRSHEGDLLRSPWHADIVTAAPVHAVNVLLQTPSRAAEIPLAMARRAERLVDAAAATAANVLVVGAWGCGAYGNDPELVATVLRVAFERPAARSFAIVDLAVADVEPGTPLYRTFTKHFHQKTF
jgi:uncharacterized protein (TIGR02452 family)